jgi:hypothetical protein
MRKAMPEKFDYFVGHSFGGTDAGDLREAIEETLDGLRPYYADKDYVEGQIFKDKILERIKETKFGLYEISQHSPSVYLELGAAIALEKRAYILCKKGTKIPSNLDGLDRIEYTSFKHLKEQLREKVQELQEIPLSLARQQLQKLEQVARAKGMQVERVLQEFTEWLERKLQERG